MTCKKIQDTLSSYIDGALAADEAKNIEEHLQQCAQCRKELEQLEEVIEMMRSLEEVPLPTGFQQELRQKLIQAKDEVGTSKNHWLQKAMKSKWLAMGVAASLLIGVLAIFDPANLPKTESLQNESFNAKVAMDAPSPVQGLGARDNMGTLDYAKVPPSSAPQRSAADFKSTITAATEEFAEPERKVIKSAQLELEVADYQETVNQIIELAAAGGGYVVNTSSYRYGSSQEIRGNISIKVTGNNFLTTIGEIEKLGETKNKGLAGEDVTQEFYDTESRLKQYRKQEERLLQLIDKAQNIEEILKVENELSRVRSEIEVMEGRVKYLTRMTEMATIDIALWERKQPSDRISPRGLEGVWQRSVGEFVATTNGIIRLVGDLLVASGRYLPVILLALAGLAVVFGLWKIIKR